MAKHKLDLKFFGQVAIVGVATAALFHVVGPAFSDDKLEPAETVVLSGLALALLGPKFKRDYQKKGTIFVPYIE
jgi:hypothetical protein